MNASLLELIAIQMHRMELSDLKCLNCFERHELALRLQTLIPREEDISDWNDALDYLTDAPPEKTALAAHKKLIELLQTENP